MKAGNPRLELFRKVLQSYIFEFKEQAIYTKSYFRNVIYPQYKQKKDLYTMIYGDFDKLRNINMVYGICAGDEALYSSLKIIQKAVGNKAIIARNGGDEVVIIIPGIEKQEAQPYIKQIQKEMEDEKENNYGISITMALEDSIGGKKFNDILKQIEQEVHQKKISCGFTEQNSWKTIEKHVRANIMNYFENLRIEGKICKNKQRIQKYEELITKIIEEYKYDGKERIIEEKNIEIKEWNPIFGEKEATVLHKFILGELEVKEIEKNKIILVQALKDLFYGLSVNTDTQLLSKLYYENVVKKKIEAAKHNKKQEYNIAWIHTTGLKISNTLIGHERTDINLHQLSKEMEERFNKKSQFFNTQPLYFNFDDCFMFDMKAGDYLITIPEQKMNIQEIKNILMKIQKEREKEILRITYSVKNTRENITVEETKEKAKKESYNKKTQQLQTMQKEIIESLLGIYVSNTLGYYYSTIKEPEKGKERLSKMFITNFKDIYNKNCKGEKEAKQM